MKRQLFKFGVVVVVAGTFTSIGVVMHERTGILPANVRERRLSTPTAQRGGGGDFLKDVPLLLVAQDGLLELRDQPGGEAVRLSLPQGALVKIVEVRLVDEKQWFLVELVEGEGQGWVMAEGVTINVAPALTFDSFEFCAGDLSGPAGPCGREIVLDGAALWLRWHYDGLEPGDRVQRVLVIGEERYATPPLGWQGPSRGDYLVNLINEHEPRVEPGLWIVEFFVNAQLVNEASVWVR